MFSFEVHYLVSKERYKDLRRDAARYRLIQIATRSQPDSRESLRKMAGRFGSRLRKWGLKLHRDNRGRHQTVTQQG